MHSPRPQRDQVSVLKLMDCHCDCAGVVAAAELEAVNVAGVRPPDMYAVFILYLRGRGRLGRVRNKQKRRRVTCSVQPGLITWRPAVTAGWWHPFFFLGLMAGYKPTFKLHAAPYCLDSVFEYLYRLCFHCPQSRSEDVSPVLTPYITTNFSLSEYGNRLYFNIRCKWGVTSSVLQVVNTIHVQCLHM